MSRAMVGVVGVALSLVLSGCGTPMSSDSSALAPLVGTETTTASARSTQPTTVPVSTSPTSTSEPPAAGSTTVASTAAVTTVASTSTTAQSAAPSVVVSALRRDADGNDNLAENKNDEWVEITNNGPGPADLTGWSIEDEGANHRYLFPSGFTLAEGAAVKVRSGCGQDTATDLYWCSSGSAVWNNDGDTAFLFNDAGELVSTSS